MKQLDSTCIHEVISNTDDELHYLRMHDKFEKIALFHCINFK